jgi:hypothetical protein
MFCVCLPQIASLPGTKIDCGAAFSRERTRLLPDLGFFRSCVRAARHTQIKLLSRSLTSAKQNVHLQQFIIFLPKIINVDQSVFQSI